MTSWVVADSGIFIATVLEETFSQQADALISRWSTQDVQIAAPILFRYEVTSVMRKSVYRNLLTPKEAIQKRDILLAQPIRLMIDIDLLKRGYDLATQYNRPAAYDAQYLAVAERLGCEFWTTDERLYNATQPNLNWVKWIGNFTTQS